MSKEPEANPSVPPTPSYAGDRWQDAEGSDSENASSAPGADHGTLPSGESSSDSDGLRSNDVKSQGSRMEMLGKRNIGAPDTSSTPAKGIRLSSSSGKSAGLSSKVDLEKKEDPLFYDLDQEEGVGVSGGPSRRSRTGQREALGYDVSIDLNASHFGQEVTRQTRVETQLSQAQRVYYLECCPPKFPEPPQEVAKYFTLSIPTSYFSQINDIQASLRGIVLYGSEKARKSDAFIHALRYIWLEALRLFAAPRSVLSAIMYVYPRANTLVSPMAYDCGYTYLKALVNTIYPVVDIVPILIRGSTPGQDVAEFICQSLELVGQERATFLARRNTVNSQNTARWQEFVVLETSVREEFTRAVYTAVGRLDIATSKKERLEVKLLKFLAKYDFYTSEFAFSHMFGKIYKIVSKIEKADELEELKKDRSRSRANR